MSLPTRLPGASQGSRRKQVTWSAMLGPSIWISCRTRRTRWVRSSARLPMRRTVPIAWHSVPMPGWALPTKPLTLQTVQVRTEQRKGDDLVSQQAGFSLHDGRSDASVACKSHQRKKLERPGGVPLCRYITRAAIAERRLSLANNGNVVIALKTPYNDGTTHVVLSPMEFMGRLAALVPNPRVNLNRFHGVFSRGGLPPNSKLREYVVPQNL
ncbi:MAG: hypothetical protein ACJAWK_000357 [Candidatus Azotimanducaceae bacterium]|jgi:hypothetical protein